MNKEITNQFERLYRKYVPHRSRVDLESFIKLLNTRREKQMQTINQTKETWEEFKNEDNENIEKMVENIRERLNTFSYKTGEEIEQIIVDELIPIKESKKKIIYEDLWNQVIDILDKEDGRFFHFYEKVSTYYMNTSKIWKDQCSEIQVVESTIDNEYTNNNSEYEKQINDLEKKFDDDLNNLKCSLNKTELDTNWSTLVEIVGEEKEFETLYRKHNTTQTETSEKHETLIMELFTEQTKKYTIHLDNGLDAVLKETTETNEDENAEEETPKKEAKKSEEPQENEETEQEQQITPSVKDPDGMNCVEYLEFDKTTYENALLKLKDLYTSMYDKLQNNEIARCKKECDIRKKTLATTLSLALRKLRLRYADCQNNAFTNRNDQIEQNEKRYRRHESRCNKLMSTAKQISKNIE
eukprot:UN23347